mgnify:CR=1 FL=1|jgi:hypothetical protein|tara:strand:+ start:504 stop:1736 length:1233 start_codon:yes stop_codon:yes gene_type:complete
MTKTATHKWIFPARFRASIYGWKSSRLACQRLREAVSEIKKVAKKEPGLAAEGAVRLIEKLWPALEHVNSSSGALGSAVNKTLDGLIPLIIKAPAEVKTRDKWLERLWQAMEDDGVDYLAPVGDSWGDLCVSAETANQWAEALIPTLRSCWTDPNPGNYFHGATACLSCLLVTRRYQELLDLLALDRKPFWHYRRFGVEALSAMGKKSEALKYAEASRGLNQPDSVIDQACETILISSGLHDEAYRRYGLSAAQGNSYLARFRAVAKRYPMKAPADILADLIETTPGEEGKWFATAKDLKLYEFALQLADQSVCEPKTLVRAARDFLESEPVFALGAALAALRWLNEGWGYEVTVTDVIDAYDLALEAATRSQIDNASDQIRVLLEQTRSAGNAFVRRSLSSRLFIPVDS